MLLSCATPTTPAASTATLLSEATGLAETDPAAAIARCVAIPGTIDRDMCLSSVAELTSDGEQAAEACALVGDQIWADECAFMRAERLLSAGDPEGAAVACLLSGRFDRRCLTHVWRAGVQEILAQPVDPDTLVAAEIGLEVRLSQAGPLAPISVDGLPDGWKTVLLFHLRHLAVIDLGLCDALEAAIPEVTAEGCATVARRVLGERLEKAWGSDGGLSERAICRAPGRMLPGAPWPSPEGPAAKVQWAWDPRLEEVFQVASARCP